MAEEFEKYAILRTQFRRRSSTEFTGAGFNQVINAHEIPKLLGELGERQINQNDLRKTIEEIDPSRTGKLNFGQYTQLCNQLVKDPTQAPIAMEFKTFSDFET